ARTEAEQMIYTVEGFLRKHGTHVTSEETNKTNELLVTLKEAIATADKDLILKRIDEINEFTRPFAERLMDQAIGTAMRGKSIE
ncbi:MAG: Hsp70 family protein, partial [Mucilaginibacter sp.]|uniref:Hsp70 family protein n=1 Tax=Mucilaginibacter sp. TaxID=1882438 RepID=UPI00319F0CE1